MKVFLGSLLLAATMAGCATPPPLPAGWAPPAPAEPVRLWQDAAIFDAVAHLVAGASARVLVEMYELGRSDVEDALAGARRRGLDVRLVYDPSV
ncbi:MAG: hypothetical protein ABI838_03105, partial [Chloroflexota bacterium]